MDVELPHKAPQPGLQDGEFCRFDFPKPLSDTTRLVFNARGQLEFISRRNDPLLNPHNPFQLQAWQANVDFKPIASLHSVVAYISKYVTNS